MFTRTKQKIYALFIPSVQQSLGSLFVFLSSFSHSFLGSMANLGRIRKERYKRSTYLAGLKDDFYQNNIDAPIFHNIIFVDDV